MVASMREVLIRLKGELDPSLRGAYRELGKLHADYGSQREAASRRASNAEVSARKQALAEERREVAESMRIAREREKALQQSYRVRATEAEKAARAQIRAERESNREAERTARDRDKAQRESERAQAQAVRDKERQERDAAKSQRRLGVEAENAAKRELEARYKLAESFRTGLSGAMQLGRGLAMLGIVGEKDTEKILKQLIKIQAAFDIMSGAVSVIVNVSKAWRAYETAVAAAAAAHTALSAAQAAVAVTSAASAGSSGLAGLAGGLLGGAARGAGGLIRSGVGRLAPVARLAANPYVSAPLAVGFAGAATYDTLTGGTGRAGAPGRALGRGVQGITQAAGEIFGADLWGTGSLRMQKRLEQQSARDRAFAETDRWREQINQRDLAAMQASQQAEDAAFALRPRDLSELTARRKQAEREYTATSARADELRKSPYTADQMMAERLVQEAARKRIDAIQQESQEVRKLNDEKIAGARESIQVLTQETTARRQQIKAIEDERKSAEERFVMAGAGGQQQALRLAERLRRGERLQANELSFLRGLGANDDTELGGMIRKQITRQAKEGGFEQLFGKDFAARQDSIKKLLSTSLQPQLTDKRQFVFTIQAENEKLATEVEKNLKALLDKQRQSEIQIINAAAERALKNRVFDLAERFNSQ